MDRPSELPGTIPSMSQVLAFLVGGGVALVAQVMLHNFTARRERRADLVRVLDDVVSAFASGERALDDLTDAVEQEAAEFPTMFAAWPPPVLNDALRDAEHVRVEMRSALFAVRLRAPHSMVFDALRSAHGEWELGFLKAKVIVRETQDFTDLPDARAHAATFRGVFYDDALDRAADAIGRVKLRELP